jgi:hypothetical protein
MRGWLKRRHRMSSCSMACRLGEEDWIVVYQMYAICYMLCSQYVNDRRCAVPLSQWLVH